MHILTLGAYAVDGLLTNEALQMFAIIACSMLVPTLIGVRPYVRFDEVTFRQLCWCYSRS
jgi:hypothetical protein